MIECEFFYENLSIFHFGLIIFFSVLQEATATYAISTPVSWRNRRHSNVRRRTHVVDSVRASSTACARRRRSIVAADVWPPSTHLNACEGVSQWEPVAQLWCWSEKWGDQAQFLTWCTRRISCSTSLICRRDTEVACARRLPVFLKSARHDVSLSAIAHLLLLAHDSGTVYLMISSLPHRSQHFANNWKLIYFGNHTQTLFYSLVAIVVLAVIFT